MKKVYTQSYKHRSNYGTNPMTRGGKRPGAGRKPVPPELKKEPISIKLPRWLIDWMDNQEESRPKLIEEALLRQHGIYPPSGPGSDSD